MLYEIICPVCGKVASRKLRAEIKKDIKSAYPEGIPSPGRYKYITRALADPTEDYWDAFLKNFEPDRDYFALVRGTGRSGLGKIEKLSPKDWPQGFEKIKRVLLMVLKSWVKKGWLKKKELTAL